MSIEYMSAVMESGSNLGLTDKEYLILLGFADYANGDGVCWPGRKGVGEKANGAAPGTVSNAVAKFEKMGYVTRTLNSAPFNGETNLYQLHIEQIRKGSPDAAGHHKPPRKGRGSSASEGGGSLTGEGGGHQPVNQTIIEPSKNISGNDKDQRKQFPGELMLVLHGVHKDGWNTVSQSDWTKVHSHSKRMWKKGIRASDLHRYMAWRKQNESWKTSRPRPSEIETWFASEDNPANVPVQEQIVEVWEWT